jgi:hypothetical protein
MQLSSLNFSDEIAPPPESTESVEDQGQLFDILKEESQNLRAIFKGREI